LATRPKKCIVPGCTNRTHAKGYCRKHYGQIWRRGEIIPDDGRAREERNPQTSIRDHQERLRALERELRKAQHLYESVIGFEGRLRWRREVEAVKVEIDKVNGAMACVAKS